nr:retrotransposable element Tf2 [Tanacetum cinerariifolium]
MLVGNKRICTAASQFWLLLMIMANVAQAQNTTNPPEGLGESISLRLKLVICYPPSPRLFAKYSVLKEMDEPEPQSKTVSTIPSSEVVPQTNSVSTTPSSGVMKALVVASGFSFGGVAVLSSSRVKIHEAGDFLGKKRILKRFLDKNQRTLIEETFLLFSGTLPWRFLTFSVSETFQIGLMAMGTRSSSNTDEPLPQDPTRMTEFVTNIVNASLERVTKIKFPKFGGEDVRGWLFKCEQFFKVDNIADNYKVNLVSIHLFDLALMWHIKFVRFMRKDVNRGAYRAAILKRFDTVYDDHLGELKKLKQTDHVQEYIDAFDRLTCRIDLAEFQCISFFLACLSSEIELAVRMFKLTTLAEVYGLFKLEEAKLNAVKQIPKPPILPTPKYLNPIPNSGPKPMALPTPNKYTPGHKCSGQVYSLEVLRNTSTELLGEQLEEEVLETKKIIEYTPHISLNAINAEGTKEVPAEISELISQYYDVFAVPTTLPPMRPCDHKIPLKEGTIPIASRPYRICIDYEKLNNATIKDMFLIPVIEELIDELQVFKEYLRRFVLVFFDDILSKCVFETEKVEYLGHVIPKDGVAIDGSKIEAMQNWPRPTNEAFIKLKQTMIEAPVLKLPNFNELFIIETDASHAGIGAILPQRGSENKAADALSKIPTSAQLLTLALSTITSDYVQQIMDSCGTDVELQKLIKDLEANPQSDKHYTWLNGQLRRKGKLVVGNNDMLRQQLLQYFHSNPSGGYSVVQATIKRITGLCYWRKLRRQVKVFVAHYKTCHTNKPDLATYPGLLQPLPILKKVWTKISMDFIKGLPFSYGKTTIFVVVDRLSYDPLTLVDGFTPVEDNIEVLMIDELSIVETDKVNHTVRTDMVKLVVEIQCFGMIFDAFDKDTGSSDELQPKKVDQNYVHALNEPHLHEIHVVLNKHEAD